MVNADILPERLPMRKIFETWWPLAFSWLLMSVELPAISAVIARLVNPEINLAAYGGIVYPLALIIEAPVIMLLSASTALSKHRQAYDRIWRFMMIAGFISTGLHILFAFTPLYYFVVQEVIKVPQQIVEPARIGLMIMTPWTWSIAYRRFQQGVMIRFGYSRAVGMGTIVRLTAGGITLLAGYLIHDVSGVIVGASAQIAGVVSEAIYAGWRVRAVLKHDLPNAPFDQLLSWRDFFKFYIPLALNSLIFLIWQPIGSAALSRMPNALLSLAVWPVVSGLTFLLRSPGIAMNEVVVASLDRPGSSHALYRFAKRLAWGTSLLHLLLAATPLAWLYFTRVSALPPNLAQIASYGFWLALPLPALSVFQSWFQGKILFGKQTRGVPESVAVFLLTVLIVLGSGVIWGKITGLYVSMAGFALANVAQMGWLWYRSRPITGFLHARDGNYH
jgi:hypothetical protein